MDNFRKYLQLNKTWSQLAIDALDEWLNKVENDFVQNNYKFIEFKRGYTNTSVISFCGRRGIRVDRVLVCEVLQGVRNLPGSCLQTGCSFTYFASHMNQIAFRPGVFHADYRIDVLKKGNGRLLWIYKDDQETQM